MADSSTLDDFLKGVSRSSLKAKCSDEHLIMIAKWLKHWKNFSADLGLTEAEEEEIEAGGGDLNRKKLDMLRKWKCKYVAEANYLKLAEVFHDHGSNDLVDKLCDLIPSVEDDGSKASSTPAFKGPLSQPSVGRVKRMEECSEEDIYTIAGHDFDWKRVGRRLIGNQKVQDIDHEGGSEGEKRESMLLLWKETKSHDATYQALVKVLRAIENNATADRVETLERESKLQGEK